MRSIRWELTDSEPEALIREAELIKKLKPRYNVLLRDDKNYLYVGFTRESFPKVFITHQMQTQESRILNLESRKKPPKIPTAKSRFKILNSKFIGPFTDGNSLKRVLKDLRKVFPYCVCRTPHKRECLSAILGRCMGVCCLKNELRITNYELRKKWKQVQKQYRKNIRMVEVVLQGERPRLLASLKKDMRKASRGQHFEEAARLRDQIRALENIFTHRPVVENTRRAQERTQALQELQKMLNLPRTPHRIEMYDMSNIHGKFAVGSMVVFVNGIPNTSQYRRFRIKTVRGINDVAMMQEVISRRLKHAPPQNQNSKIKTQKYNSKLKTPGNYQELKTISSAPQADAVWPLPDVLVVDGGKTQISAAKQAFVKTLNAKRYTINPIPILGLAKGRDELHISSVVSRRSLVVSKALSRSLQHLLTHLQDEAHRFAITYHKKLRRIDPAPL